MKSTFRLIHQILCVGYLAHYYESLAPQSDHLTELRSYTLTFSYDLQFSAVRAFSKNTSTS